jgi:hypothetical protein
LFAVVNTIDQSFFGRLAVERAKAVVFEENLKVASNQPTILKVDVNMMELLEKAMSARSYAKVSTSGFRILASKKRKRE